MRLICFFLAFFFAFGLMAQNLVCGGDVAFEVLHFTKTNGFDHNTRNVSHTMFQEIGASENFTVVNSQDASVFDDLPALLEYEAIIFSNTSGNNLLNATQRNNLEAYIAAGGSFLGIHAATDTYRNQSWPFYNQLVGGIVQSGPNHTSQNFNGIMDIIGDHASTVNLPNPWEKQEEYYYWELNGGQLSPDIVETLRVRQTGNNSYDAARPISWYQTFESGARSYYTALGHAGSNYTDPNNDFRQLIRDALCWCVESEMVSNTSSPSQVAPQAQIVAGANALLRLRLSGIGGPVAAKIFNGQGITQTDLLLFPGLNELGTELLSPGYYFVVFENIQLRTVKFIVAN
ncbi:MAG: ThuA domain-containing protein [Bacteroidota bacterium]